MIKIFALDVLVAQSVAVPDALNNPILGSFPSGKLMVCAQKFASVTQA